MKKFIERLLSKKGFRMVIRILTISYLGWAAVAWVYLLTDFGSKEEAYVVDMGMMLIGTFMFFVPFALGFLFGKTGKGE